MIDLTPLEVRQKKGDFRRGMRGYEASLVDDFLDLVADRMEQLVRENHQLTERLARVEEQVRETRDRERALTEALVTAQEMREEMRQQAMRDAETARRDAEAQAARIMAEAARAVEREAENLRRLQLRQRQVVASYRSFLERELTELRIEAEALERGGADDAGAGPRAGATLSSTGARSGGPPARKPADALSPAATLPFALDDDDAED
jgi:cell division initiation protein